ncbi:hypothetical protein Pint_17610 [Pistacia integerrima]|uniref:Uncharacterized protein n=1 Tax=Pistacia integerrima TaxID=434235 RepID=A0ACC0YWK4_9ROSI|nr:hypothetical protein Pint_17610 [Pistacia integerrima]
MGCVFEVEVDGLKVIQSVEFFSDVRSTSSEHEGKPRHVERIGK